MKGDRKRTNIQPSCNAESLLAPPRSLGRLDLMTCPQEPQGKVRNACVLPRYTILHRSCEGQFRRLLVVGSAGEDGCGSDAPDALAAEAALAGDGVAVELGGAGEVGVVDAVPAHDHAEDGL